MAKKRRTTRKTKTGPRRSFLRTAGKWTATLGVWAFIIGLFGAGWLYTDIPDFEESLSPSRTPTIWILAADGSELASVGDLYGIPVTLSDLPPSLPQAVLATEDRRFYNHFGVDLIGLTRAMVANIRAGRIVQGGSTITQQVAKNLFLTSDRTYKRKLQEVMVALWLENKFSKDQILALYLNRVYLGAGTYGVDAAARKYFGVSATDVTVWQSALLAGLLKAPSRFNPHSSQERAAARTKVVLSNMVTAGYLTEQEASNARAIKSRGDAVRPGRNAPYFVDWVLDQVRDYAGNPDRDLIVRTTLDPTLQRNAEQRLIGALSQNGQEQKIGQGAILVMRPDGAVAAMVGGRSYRQSQFNRAVQARRQPGSAFKPVIYLAGLQAGLKPSDIIEDAPITVGTWSPNNFDGKFLGPISLQEGLARSSNSVAVRVALEAGMPRVTKTARSLGLDPGDAPDASVALGTGETSLMDLVAGYAPFANGGMGILPFGIEEIRDGGGNLLYQRTGSGSGRVVDAKYVGPMNAMLRSVVDTGTGRAARLDRPAAGKTGTSQNHRDAWFVGYTADYVGGVWLGNDDSSPMRRVTGGGLPATLWRDVMTTAHQGRLAKALPSGGADFSSAVSGQANSQANSQARGQAATDDGFFSRIFSNLKEASDKYEAERQLDQNNE
jgi:penicillin-binding protein 1A